ncbi:ArnT family glycosyltransferase [Verrucomicrobiota bacterium sgz303538]
MSSTSSSVNFAKLPRWFGAAVVTFIVLLFLGRNLPWHLDDYDQAKQAFVSFEMVKEGNWWFQHTPTGRVATKPPLAGWISAGIATVTGGNAWDLAWRLPPFLSALIIMLLLWRSGRQLAGQTGAIIAVAAFGLNLFAPRLATLVRTDMMLTLWIFLAGYLVYEKLRTGAPWSTGDRWAMFAFILASMLTKGPIAYAFLLPGMVVFWWLERRSPVVKNAWSGWWSWFGPLLFFGLWAGIGIAFSQEFYQQVVLDEFLGRFTVGEGAKHHNFGPHFYFLQLLHRFFPWAEILVLLACIPDVRAKLRRDPALLWLVCWAVGGVVFMSLVPSKRPDRIFPAVPPLCLLLAGMISLVPQGRFGKWSLPKILAIATGIAVIASGGYTVYRVVEGYKTHQRTLVDFGHRVRASVSPDRLALVSGKDEGMLLYTGKTKFTRAGDASDAWKAGQLDAVVIPVDELAKRKADFPSHRIAFESVRAPEKNNPFEYALIVRE